jgi:hypothetical protein
MKKPEPGDIVTIYMVDGRNVEASVIDWGSLWVIVYDPVRKVPETAINVAHIVSYSFPEPPEKLGFIKYVVAETPVQVKPCNDINEHTKNVVAAYQQNPPIIDKVREHLSNTQPRKIREHYAMPVFKKRTP